MKANPGGMIDVKNILGRDGLVERIWEILQQQSVVITAERRVGKTCAIRKMQAEPPPGWFPVYQDLEQVHSAEEFAHTVYEQVQKFLGRFRKAANRAKRFLDDHKLGVAGSQIERVRDRPWKGLLVCSIEDLTQEQPDARLLFLWDELPYMLDNILRREGPEIAEEVLDLLRTLRHTFPAFRMVLTGSVGLHHVLARLREAEYANEPTNDMYSVDVTPLAPADAELLAIQLIAGEGLPCSDRAASAATIAQEADYVPFYVHHVVRCLKMTGRAAEPECIAEAVREQLVDPNDPWELAHYRERIAKYYEKDAGLMHAILDELSVAEEPRTVGLLFEAIKSQMQFDDRNRLLRLLRLAERDHYLSRTPEGAYGFRFPLLKRWWRLDRGL